MCTRVWSQRAAPIMYRRPSPLDFIGCAGRDAFSGFSSRNAAAFMRRPICRSSRTSSSSCRSSSRNSACLLQADVQRLGKARQTQLPESGLPRRAVVDHQRLGKPPNCQKAFSRQRRKSSVVWRNVASLYPLRECDSTMRNTCVRRRRKSAPITAAPLPKSTCASRPLHVPAAASAAPAAAPESVRTA